jgi:hypothetical protein
VLWRRRAAPGERHVNASGLLRSIARAQQWLSRTRSRPSLAKGTVNVACLGFGSERFGSVETEV